MQASSYTHELHSRLNYVLRMPASYGTRPRSPSELIVDCIRSNVILTWPYARHHLYCCVCIISQFKYWYVFRDDGDQALNDVTTAKRQVFITLILKQRTVLPDALTKWWEMSVEGGAMESGLRKYFVCARGVTCSYINWADYAGAAD